jgi:hypothetical protein
MQARGAIELCHDRRQLDTDPPLVVASSGRGECLAPAVPPGETGDRLDNQHASPVGRTVEQTGQERVTSGVAELVEGERRQNRRPRKPGDGDIDALCSSGEAEGPIGLDRLRQRPRMAIDPDDLRRPIADRCPRRACGTGSTSEIDQGGR